MALYGTNGKFVGTQPATSGGLYSTAGKLQPIKPASQPASGKGALWDAAGGLIKAVTNSEQEFGKDLSTIGSSAPGTAATINAQTSAGKQKLLEAAHNEADPAKKAQILDAYGKIYGEAAPVSAGDINPAFNKTPAQVLGDAGGVALDALSGGTYGHAAKGAETGRLLVKGAQTAAPAVVDATKTGLTQTLKGIGTKTAIHSAVGAGTGYGYDVSQNLQNGKTGTDAFAPGMGTAAGAIIPLGIGAFQAASAITADQAPRVINSLIKPNAASFSYGKNPGRTVSEMGITGNSIEDFAHNIGTAKNEVGSQLGAIYSNPANAGVRIDATPVLTQLDSTIQEAAKGGKNNQGIVTALQNVKDALLHDHGVDGDGNIVKINAAPNDLSSLNPQQAFNLKSKIADLTQFTGRPSDDKTVNSTLKSMYGDLKNMLNGAVQGNNPEISDFNQKYADLTSAELATRNRNAIIQRGNMISMPVKFGTAAGIITALGTGGAAVPAIMAGAGAAALEKALGSTAVKTRVAAWLGSESPSVIQRVLQSNPGISTVLYRALPKFASQIGQ
jgi:hypothetical protein